MEWLTEEELLAAAAGRGCDVSPRQLRRWRSKGFVDRGRLWRGRARGSATFYPAYALDQLVAACHTIRRGRDLEISLVLAGAFLVLELDAPLPPGFRAALLYWRRLSETLSESERDIEQHTHKHGVPGIHGMSRIVQADAVAALLTRSPTPSDEGVAALTELTNALQGLVARHVSDVHAPSRPAGSVHDEEASLVDLSSRNVLDVWSEYLSVDPGVIERAVTSASDETLATAIKIGAASAHIGLPKRRSADQVAIELASATCWVLVREALNPGSDEDET